MILIRNHLKQDKADNQKAPKSNNTKPSTSNKQPNSPKPTQPNQSNSQPASDDKANQNLHRKIINQCQIRL